jgi:hypothetical protein
LWPDLSPAEHIRIFADLRGLSYEEEILSIKQSRMAAQRAGLAPLEDADEDEDDETVEHDEMSQLKKKMTRK